MAWSNTTGTATNVTATTMADIPSDGATVAVALNPGETVNVQIEADFPTTPTDDLQWQILASPDGGTTWDVLPVASGLLENTSDPNRVTVQVFGFRTIKVQAARVGSTDTIAVTVRVAKDGVSL